VGQISDPELTDRMLRQGKALVRAIEAMGTIEWLDKRLTRWCMSCTG